MRRFDMSRLILNATPMNCKGCGKTVWCWFPDRESYDEWCLCSDCEDRIPVGYDERMEDADRNKKRIRYLEGA